MPSSINSRRAESESGLQRVRNCSARRLAAVLSSADELAFFVFIGLTVARAPGGAPFQFLAAAWLVNAEHSAKPAITSASQWYRALFLPLRRRGVSRPVGYAPPEPSRMLEVLSRLPKLKPRITRMARINKNLETEQAG